MCPESGQCPNTSGPGLPGSSCTAGQANACKDGNGNLTVACPVSGFCPLSTPSPSPLGGSSDNGNSGGGGNGGNGGNGGSGGSGGSGGGNEPPWCQTLPPQNNTAEICDLSFVAGGACNDGLDNDADGGTDSGLQGGGPDQQCEVAFNRAADGFNDNGHLIQPVGPCNMKQCPGTQLFAEIAPHDATGQCTKATSCAAIRYFYAACQTQCNDGIDNDGDNKVDINDPECGQDLHHASEASDVPACKDKVDNDGDAQTDLTDGGCDGEEDDDECGGNQDLCQQSKGCPKFSTCTNPNGIFPDGKCTKGNCCADTVPKCTGTATCFECVIAPPGDPEANNGTSACNDVVAQDPERDSGWCQKNIPGGCACKSGKCVQCKKFGQKDEEFCNQIKTPYCSTAGACVECNADIQCVGKGEKSRCRVAKFDRNMRNTCQDECHDGIDNDGDGGIDATGLDRNGDNELDVPHDMQCLGHNSTRERAQCSDTIDNDGDGKIDFNADPGCLSPDDNDERNDNSGGGGGDGENPSVSPEPSYACSDHVDNDGDSLIDYPIDPGCVNSLDPDESNTSFQCSDHVDNDFDGKIDYPADPGCISSVDNSEIDTTPLITPTTTPTPTITTIILPTASPTPTPYCWFFGLWC